MLSTTGRVAASCTLYIAAAENTVLGSLNNRTVHSQCIWLTRGRALLPIPLTVLCGMIGEIYSRSEAISCNILLLYVSFFPGRADEDIGKLMRWERKRRTRILRLVASALALAIRCYYVTPLQQSPVSVGGVGISASCVDRSSCRDASFSYSTACTCLKG